MLPEKLDIAEKRKSAPWVVSKSTLHIVFSTTVEHLHSAKKNLGQTFKWCFRLWFMLHTLCSRVWLCMLGTCLHRSSLDTCKTQWLFLTEKQTCSVSRKCSSVINFHTTFCFKKSSTQRTLEVSIGGLVFILWEICHKVLVPFTSSSVRLLAGKTASLQKWFKR